jgi:hypothetical protein
VAGEPEAIYSVRVTAQAVARQPAEELDDTARGVVFVAWPRPPRVGSWVTVEIGVGEGTPTTRLQAHVVWSRPARSGVIAGFRARIEKPPPDLLAQLRDVVSAARESATSRSEPRRAVAIDGPVVERVSTKPEMTPIGSPISKTRSGSFTKSSAPPARPPSSTSWISHPSNPPRSKAPPSAPPPPTPPASLAPPPEQAPPEPRPSRPPSVAPPSNPPDIAGLQRAPTGEFDPFEINVHGMAATLAPGMKPLVSPSSVPPGASRPPNTPAPSRPSSQPPGPRSFPDEPVITPQPSGPVTQPKWVSVVARQRSATSIPPAPRGPQLRLSVTIGFSSPKNFLAHFDRFLSRGIVYFAEAPVPEIGSVVSLTIEIPDGGAKLRARGTVMRSVNPPEVPRAGWLAMLIDPDGSGVARLSMGAGALTAYR